MTTLAQPNKKTGIKDAVTNLRGARLVQLTSRDGYRDGQFATGKYALILTGQGYATKEVARTNLTRLKKSVERRVGAENITEVTLPSSVVRQAAKNLANIVGKNFPNSKEAIKGLGLAKAKADQPVNLSKAAFPARDLLDRPNTDGHIG